MDKDFLRDVCTTPEEVQSPFLKLLLLLAFLLLILQFIKVDSAIRYYEKLLRRNIALRKVIGPGIEYYIKVGKNIIKSIFQNVQGDF